MVTKLRIALAQVNATVGDLDGNAELIVAWTRQAAERGARVVVFPEMMLTGYPVEDLALRASFVEASIATLHAVALISGGRVVVTSAKPHLPNYGVFDEFRYFVPGDTLPVFRLPTPDGQSVEVAIA